MQKLYRKVLMKYKIMRVRAKISYQALVSRMTIKELYLNSILKCYEELVSAKEI